MRLPSFLTGLSPVGKVVDAMEQGASALETEAQRHNAQVTVSTAAGNHEIPGLLVEDADELRDLIATQARLAQEDL